MNFPTQIEGRKRSGGLCNGVLWATLLVGLGLCGCIGPRECTSDVQALQVDRGRFVAQVQQAGTCNRWSGKASFTPAVGSPFRDEQPVFFAALRVSIDEGPRLYCAQRGEGIEEKSYDVADLSNTTRNALETFGAKMSVGGQRVNGHRVLSKSGTVSMEKVRENTVAASFDVTFVTEKHDAGAGADNEVIRVAGQFRAVKDDDPSWVII